MTTSAGTPDVFRCDAELVQIVEASLADASQRALRPDGSSWLACRAGCTPCCHGVFRISALDALRLQRGLALLAGSEQEAERDQATAIKARARALVAELGPLFPGDRVSGLLREVEDSDGAWDEFADLPAADAACPALSPLSGRCELYASRPLTCRIFGPPVASDGGVGVCELCYVGAGTAELLHGEMHLAHQQLEEEIGRDLPKVDTVIAWALLGSLDPR